MDRVFLWLGFGVSIAMPLCLALTAIAGNRREGSRPGRDFALVALVVFAVHAGFVLAPWAIGEQWWRWSFWAMTPLSALAAIAASTPFVGAIRWTRPDGRSGWTTVASAGVPAALFASVYVAPPVVLWLNRPLDV